MDRSVHVLQQKVLSWHISFTRTTSQSPCLREILATVVITRGNSRSVFSLVSMSGSFLALYPFYSNVKAKTYLLMRIINHPES